MFSQISSYFSKQPYHDKRTHHSYLVVPDLHGTYSLYKQVEAYLKDKVEKNRTIIFLGDYMNRGERGVVYGKTFKDAGSYKIIKDLISLKQWALEEGREMIFLRGNHEIFYEDYYLKNETYAYDEYGFFKESVTCLSHAFEKNKKFYDDFILFLNQLEPFYLDEKYHYLFIHAGIDPDEKELQKQVDDGLVYWIRDKFLFSEKKLPYTVIFGHTPFSKPFMRSDKIGLDSGVYKRGFINLLKIDNENSKIIRLDKAS